MPDNNNALVDLSLLHEYTDGEQEAIQEFIDVFNELALESLEALEGHIAEGECIAWASAAHKLKGAAGYIGSAALSALCSRAQAMVVASQSDRASMFSDIRDTCNRVTDELSRICAQAA